MTKNEIVKPADNEAFSQQFEEIISLIRQKRNEALRYVNAKVIETYWLVGKYVSEKISSSAWGEGVVKQLSAHIARTAPDLKGFSDKNLWRMRQFYEAYCQNEKLSTLLREITWSNNLCILSRTKSEQEREFYLRLCAAENLSFRELNRQIDASFYERTMLSAPKVSTALREFGPKAERAFRDSYVFEFITGEEEKPESTFKQALISKMRNFILELGKDFTYVGREYRLRVGMKDYSVDLLFFHRALQCFVAFEVKTGEFHPEDLGQINFYLEALDRDVKKPHENPSIGVLLCRDKDDTVVEYALSRSVSPTLVAQYQMVLPDKKILQEKMQEFIDTTPEN